MDTTIYIDTGTGAFGGAQELVIVEARDDQVEDLHDSHDSTIIDFGLRYGDRVLDMVGARPPAPTIGVSPAAGDDGFCNLMGRLQGLAFRVVLKGGRRFEGLLVLADERTPLALQFNLWDEADEAYTGESKRVRIDDIERLVYL